MSDDFFLTEARITLSEAIGYLDGQAFNIDRRRNPWWRFWKTDSRPNHARELVVKLESLRRKLV